jgi:hypothetical protein
LIACLVGRSRRRIRNKGSVCGLGSQFDLPAAGVLLDRWWHAWIEVTASAAGNAELWTVPEYWLCVAAKSERARQVS